jgi:pantoate--beta-alanine ligase
VKPVSLATPALVRDVVRGWREEGRSVGLVPTMGALHAGHLSLVTRAAGENDRVVVSIFVNPLQFGPEEDYARYPRDPAGDVAKLAGAGVHAIYMPSADRMYPPDSTTRVDTGPLGDILEGAHRPGHFEGVATVVAKLFNAVLPDRAYFGQKDAQQAAVVRRLARDLDFPVEVMVCPTVREPEGLALSSRNAYLSPEERRAATCLSAALRAAAEAWRGGERDPARLQAAMRRILDAEPLARADYAEAVDPSDFVSPGPLAVLAVHIGATRLIDNHDLRNPFPG